MGDTVSVRDFTVTIADDDIEDLRDRLRRTRLPNRETVTDWSQGVPTDYLREVLEYWEQHYDMQRLARRLNRHPQFIATSGDLEIHFLHIRSPHDNARPLIMTHGWPGSVLEFLEVIEPLTDPTQHGGSEADAFHLVIPALIGYGFSSKPTQPGVGLRRMGQEWDALMQHLGYPKYYAQGGDWGGLLAATMAADPPEGLLGVHLNLAMASPEALGQFDDLTDAERELGGMPYYQQVESGYALQQSTRPQTLGYGLADSPAGQLAWVLEKFYTWTHCDGHPENAISRDELLDNAMMYWLTNSGASSARLYWESMADVFASMSGTVSLPTAYSQFPRELFRVSERWLRTRFSALKYYNSLSQGGHFAALEQPDLFVGEVRAAIRALQA